MKIFLRNYIPVSLSILLLYNFPAYLFCTLVSTFLIVGWALQPSSACSSSSKLLGPGFRRSRKSRLGSRHFAVTMLFFWSEKVDRKPPPDFRRTGVTLLLQRVPRSWLRRILVLRSLAMYGCKDISLVTGVLDYSLRKSGEQRPKKFSPSIFHMISYITIFVLCSFPVF